MFSPFHFPLYIAALNSNPAAKDAAYRAEVRQQNQEKAQRKNAFAEKIANFN
tara:strand:- start:128 stop:283 length:156 start_codon:yes stop_codon:yes gene_type:complete